MRAMFCCPLGLPTRLDGNHLGAVVVFTDEVDMNTDLAERWGRAPQFAAQGVRLLGPRLFFVGRLPDQGAALSAFSNSVRSPPICCGRD